jgi:hypothetical protein
MRTSSAWSPSPRRRTAREQTAWPKPLRAANLSPHLSRRMGSTHEAVCWQGLQTTGAVVSRLSRVGSGGRRVHRTTPPSGPSSPRHRTPEKGPRPWRGRYDDVDEGHAEMRAVEAHSDDFARGPLSGYLLNRGLAALREGSEWQRPITAESSSPSREPVVAATCRGRQINLPPACAKGSSTSRSL